MTKGDFAESVSNDEIKMLPLIRFGGEIIVVDHPDTVPEAVDMLRGHDVLGFDTETRPAFKKGVVNGVALLQLSTSERAFIFRLNRTGLPLPLVSVLADRKIIKAGAAIRDDIRSLQKLARFRPAGFVELQEMVKDYNIEDSGLRKLAAIVLGIQISKSQQVSNWEKENLTDAQLIYAATDAWVCHEIYGKLTGRAR